MSFILDALNKAEKSRQQHIEPSVSLPMSHAAPNGSKTNKIYIFAAVIFGMIAALLISQNTNDTNPKQAAQSPSLTIQNAEPTKNAIPVVSTTPTVSAIPSIAPSLTPAKIVASQKMLTQPEDVTIPTLMQLPPHIQNALPNIRISAHTYGKDTNKRMVMMNNKVLHEGSRISNDLILKQITPTGVELLFQDELFTMKASEAWPF